MSSIEFPSTQVANLHSAAAKLLDSRKPGSDDKSLARSLLLQFHDLCLRAGLDRVLADLERAFPPLDVTDRTALADHLVLAPALAAQIAAAELDGGGPRNAKPGQLADGLVAALGLAVIDEPDRRISLSDDTRVAAAAALAGVLDVELAVPTIRESIVTAARAGCEERYRIPFDRIAAQLDERGIQMVKQPRVPIDASQAVQRLLFDTRVAFFARIGRLAVDRAQAAIARDSAEAAARIDQPITLALTPREVAVVRIADASVVKTSAGVGRVLLDSLAELARFTWRAPERAARPYAASQTFAVGDLVDHPKFGRGAVVATAAQRIEVEFPDGKLTLAHTARPR